MILQAGGMRTPFLDPRTNGFGSQKFWAFWALARPLGDVEELLIDMANDFIERVVTFSCQLAKHRGSDTLEAKDIQLHLGVHVSTPPTPPLSLSYPTLWFGSIVARVT